VIRDNRLAALASDEGVYIYDSGDEPVKAEVILRRAFKGLMDQRGWMCQISSSKRHSYPYFDIQLHLSFGNYKGAVVVI
jgi:hypothetical protein